VSGQEHAEGSLAQIEAAGALLAEFHAATTGLVPSSKKIFPRLRDPKSLLRGLTWARNRRISQGLDDKVGDVVAGLVATAEGIGHRLPDKAYWALPQCIVHGDYHPANLKFQGDQVAGLFDFDWVGPGPRMVDAAREFARMFHPEAGF
jgi:Ser/Thr protein kinase RdoA (MazF antagonist)